MAGTPGVAASALEGLGAAGVCGDGAAVEAGAPPVSAWTHTHTYNPINQPAERCQQPTVPTRTGQPCPRRVPTWPPPTTIRRTPATHGERAGYFCRARRRMLTERWVRKWTTPACSRSFESRRLAGEGHTPFIPPLCWTHASSFRGT
eukprot:3428302-Pyramimonas_sp.AAC.1